jgi:ABC-2 type transport system ATP-binding protein
MSIMRGVTLPSPFVPAVEVDGLVVRYGERAAVDGLSFEAVHGEVLALLGPNGAGKTTTVETTEGYRIASAGSVRVLGCDPRAERDRIIARIGVMLQRGGVYPAMTPAEAMHLFAAYYDAPADPEVLLDRLGLRDAARTPWRRLSGGEQQRLSLALALVGRPEVAFLDEPTAGVDPHGRQAIRNEIRSLRDAGVCVVLTTHELEEAERLADRVVIIDHGRAVASGRLADLLAGAGNELRFAAPPGLDVAALGLALGAVVVREPAPGEYVVVAAPDPALVAAVTAWLAEHRIPLGDLRAGRRSLEELFLRLTGESSA